MSVSAENILCNDQQQFNRRMSEVGWCAGFPAADAVATLASRGINVDDFSILFDCLAKVGRSWDFRESKQFAESERLIAAHASELIELIRRTEQDGGWRHVWDIEHGSIETSVEIDPLIDDLETLAQNASQRLEQIALAKNIGVHPQSGKTRYFYWMSLLAFWKFVLELDVKASDNGINRPSGPLVAFVETMSVGMDGSVMTPGAIRKFVARHRDDVDKFARAFLPALIVRLHRLANGR